MFREGLRRLLGEPLFEVIGAASSAEEAVAIAAEASPALVVWGLGAVDQLEEQISTMRECCAGHEGARLVVLTDVSNVSWLRRVASSGVDAILTPDISTEVLQRSLDLVVLGQQLFPAALAHAADPTPPVHAPSANGAPKDLISSSAPASHNRSGEIVFSSREGQILRCLMTGASNKAIARELSISEIAVKAHVKALLRKVRVSNRTQAAIWAHHNDFRIVEAPAEVAPFPAIAGASRQRASA